MSSVTVMIPSIPGREDMLQRALDSVSVQRRQPDAVHVERDPTRTGAAATRNRGLRHVTTKYVALLDDDDWLLPNHLETLMQVAEDTDADVVYPTPRFVGHDPRCVRVGIDGKLVPPWGLEWTEQHRNYLITRGNFIPVTTLVKVRSIRRVGGFPERGDIDFNLSPHEDWLMFRRLAKQGFRFVHCPEETWVWEKGTHHTGGNGT